MVPSKGLAPYAAQETASLGRRFAEAPPLGRGEFQRDRDRIVHSTAFRRLEYKTQVFVNHEGDLFRTRLTHSLEVAQLARGIARSLGLNEDLTEAIALAHDLGHTPFGHAGQDALHTCMAAHGGFEHNLQSLRIVDVLEEQYAEFDGLNLCFETREGILKHCSLAHARELGEIGQRFVLKQQPSLEAQVANLADEIAYNNHDVDDGLRSGLITVEQLASVPLFAEKMAVVQAAYPQLSGRRLIHEILRRMINALALDLMDWSQGQIDLHRPQSIQDVRQGPRLIGFSPDMGQRQRELKLFLRENLYQHYRVRRMTSKAQRIISDLFQAFLADPRLLPTAYWHKSQQDQPARVVADYIAGMTDRYAIAEHKKLFAVGEYSVV